jgi:thioredoxin reductase (NADPH)
MSTFIHKLIIIGSGPAGLTAAVYAARANLAPLVIDGPTPGGQLMSTTYVENWPGEKSILGPSLMMNMQEHATSFGAIFISENIVNVTLQKKPFTLTTHKNSILQAQALIIATGATPKRLHCPGEDTYWGKGVTTCAVCDGVFYKDQPVVIVGGGDTAMENASFMLNFTNDITIIHILDTLTASQAMQKRILNNPSVKIIYSSTVTSIQGNSTVTSVTIMNMDTKTEHTIATNAVFVSIGLTPNTQLFKDQLTLTASGYVLLHNHTHTSIEGVFAAGDVADARYRQAISSAGVGCMAALDAERYIKEYSL